MNSYVLRVFAVLALIVTSAASSYAGSADRITLQIPFAFTVGERTLPAGTYGVRQLSPGCVALVSSESGHATMLLTAAIPAERMPTRAKLVFHRYGTQYFLAEVWTPERSQGQQPPTSAAERSLQRQLKEQGEDGLARASAEPDVVTLLARR